ncbi:heterokaryon incompatibility protein-domain-containing protein [Cadophora sp. MPI-SDFR-AT-0126]|nr:heterokaryon incompatibility protein-domain-containing protein [Leotiomycetes sp. MPI-SDFR-AT-0126]
MRLLNTTTLLLEEFIGDNIPYYSILSHRWENEEVTFQDLREGRGPGMAGYSKITGCCRQAKLDGWDYAWVDSCCIDKSSSAELSEAINSMFKWYQNAAVCYAYLSDVGERSEFGKSQWFTRGWTLQELLAPEFLIFYDKNWVAIDTKLCLLGELETITGISVEHLTYFERASIAQKMSWASKRRTTRIEDEAYCLMGLFDINMPPLYGEGSKAFLRLQLEILRTSDDETIFAWMSEPGDRLLRGLLAHSVANFSESSTFTQGRKHPKYRPPYSVTNQGLRIDARLKALTDDPTLPQDYQKVYLMPINVRIHGDSKKTLALRVAKHRIRNDFGRIRSPGTVMGDHTVWRSGQTTIHGPLSDGDEQVCYFPQRSYRRVRESIAITINLHHPPDYGLLSVVMHKKDNYCYGSLKAPASTIRLNIKPYEEVALIFGQQRVTCFGLYLRSYRLPPTIKIIRQENNSPSGEEAWAKNHHPSPDKASYLLKSGESISYHMRRHQVDPQMMSAGARTYVVDVTIDPQGSLTWPRQSLGQRNSDHDLLLRLELTLRRILAGTLALESLEESPVELFKSLD